MDMGPYYTAGGDMSNAIKYDSNANTIDSYLKLQGSF